METTTDAATASWRLLCARRHRQYHEAAARHGDTGLGRHFLACAAAAQYYRDRPPHTADPAEMDRALELAASRWVSDERLLRAPRPVHCARCYDLGLGLLVFSLGGRDVLAHRCRCAGNRFALVRVQLPPDMRFSVPA